MASSEKCPQISVRGVSKAFGSNVVLKNVSIEIEAGKVTAILGPSGTGKSVLLKLITGLLSADTGEIFIRDTDMVSCSPSERSQICSKIGLLFQSAALFDSLTLLENVAFPLRYTTDTPKNQVKDLAINELEKVGLVDAQNKLPGEVSIGVRKRAGIARALITKPSILLFDEPNTGLDPLVGQEIYDLINEVREKHSFTGIIVSHEIPEVFQCCDEIVMLYGGEKYFQGNQDQFLSFEHPVVQQFASGSTEGPIQIST